MATEFLDFELRLNKSFGGGYSVSVDNSPVGKASAKTRFPFDDAELRSRLEEIGIVRGLSTRAGKVHSASRDMGGHQAARAGHGEFVKKFGSELFDALMPMEIRSSYRSCRNMARAQDKGLRIRLRIDAPELAALPWEFLFDESEGDFVCLSKFTPVIRYLELALPTSRLIVKPPLKILGMVASPVDLDALDVESEKWRMNEAILNLQDQGEVSLTWLDGQSWRDLQKAMRGGPWHIFHFIGHGSFDETAQEGQILLADDEGKSNPMSATKLGRLLASHASMRLVVLNSCEQARASTTDLYSSTGAVLTRRGIPAVVSMQYEITDRAALEFSRTFYDTLAEGKPVDEAVTEARMAISNNSEDETLEWATPVLHMQASDGRLFEIDAAGAIFPETKEPPPARPLPLVTPATEVPVVQPLMTAPAADETQRGLSILLRKVKQFWVEGVLENSLSHSGLIDLGLDTLPDMVHSPWGPTPLDPRQPIASICDELGGSFLILGVPGAGKTTIMLSLVRELIAQVEKDLSRPIPIVINLTSWTDINQSLFDWIVDELSAKYGIPKKIGRSWLEQSRLKLFLDGLDEVGPDRRAACLEAINTFTQTAGFVSVVVCCRFNEYIDLPTRLTLNGAIRLRTLSREQIAAHLARYGDRLLALGSLLKRDSSLQALAETPFMLSMMIRTYQDLPPGEISSGQFATIEARKWQVMEAYVQRQFRNVHRGDQP